MHNSLINLIKLDYPTETIKCDEVNGFFCVNILDSKGNNIAGQIYLCNTNSLEFLEFKRIDPLNYREVRLIQNEIIGIKTDNTIESFSYKKD